MYVDTPTTDFVADFYAGRFPNRLDGYSPGVRRQQFEQWLSFIQAQAWEQGYATAQATLNLQEVTDE